MTSLWALLRRTPVQRGVRAAIAAGLAWQVAVLLPPLLSEYAYYAPLGAVIAVHPTVADSASAAWRSVLAILTGFGLAVAVYELTRQVPNALTIALIVALAVAVEQWQLWREQASWVSFAAVLMITVGLDDPNTYVLRYAGLTLLGALVGVLVTTVLFPPMQLTQAVEQIGRTRAVLAAHLGDIAATLREGHVPDPAEWAGRGRRLDRELDRMRAAENRVERARRANPRARRWQGRAAGIRAESRAVDRVAVLVDDLVSLVVEFQPHRRGVDLVDAGTGWVLADALDGLAGVVRTPHDHVDGTIPDGREESVTAAVVALDRLVGLLRSARVADEEGFFALGAVAVGVRRGLLALDATGQQKPAA
ncbi:FUSC family protein [Geodermatophilus ruber]|uniref:Aromatic acid exporter family member 1 n=1 Tax=Geodermatophilus ruber TaxID=504800 RepID=A0A1I4KBW2_9ACTN|nr:aromatic acid exporter family protein [Geodermatophilus ruber]SFL75966.1 Aromatic acid exporter family member 1 [Geodermatophilus ruber]